MCQVVPGCDGSLMDVLFSLILEGSFVQHSCLKLSRLFFNCFNLIFNHLLIFSFKSNYSKLCWVVDGCLTLFLMVLGCCRCFKMFRSAFEGFLGFKVAVNNTHLSQRATWRCFATHVLFFSFCSLPSRMLSVISAR